MMTRTVPTLAFAILFGLAACQAPLKASGAAGAETAEVADPRRGAPVNRLCFVSTIDGFTETTRRTVVVEARVNDFYQIETVGSCFDLDDALTIAFDTFGGSNCLSRGDTILASDSAFGLSDGIGIGPQRCTIRQIYQWDPDTGDSDAPDADGSAGDKDGSGGEGRQS